MAVACPFCHADVASDARMCRGCGLNIATWLANNPGAKLPGWVGPPADESRGRGGAAGREPSAAERAVAEAEHSSRRDGAILMFFFAIANVLIARYFADMILGDTGAGARVGAYTAAAVYGGLGVCVLLGWQYALWLGFFVYLADSVWLFKSVLFAGQGARIGSTLVSRFMFARLIYRTAQKN